VVQARAVAVCPLSGSSEWGIQSVAPPSFTGGPAGAWAPGESGVFGPPFDDETTEDLGTSIANDQGRLELGCPAENLLLLRYREAAPAAPANYGPFVQRALTKARILHERYSCQSPCGKAAFKEEYVRWYHSPPGPGSPNGAVEVMVHFKVKCKTFL